MADLDYKKIAKNIVRYYWQARGVGHTQTLMNGVHNTPNALALFSAHNVAEHYGVRRSQIMTLTTAERGEVFQGRTDPLAIDHHAIVTIFRGLLDEITRLENKVKELETTK